MPRRQRFMFADQAVEYLKRDCKFEGKVIFIKKNSLGIKTWGVVDFLVNYHKYLVFTTQVRIMTDDNLSTNKSKNRTPVVDERQLAQTKYAKALLEFSLNPSLDNSNSLEAAKIALNYIEDAYREGLLLLAKNKVDKTR